MKELIELFKKQNFKKVIEEIEKKKNPIQLLELKGMSALQLKYFEMASECFKNLIKVNSNSSNHYHLALCYMSLKNYKLASIEFEKSSIDENFFTASIINNAHCLYQSNNTKQAEKLLLNLLSEKSIVNQAVFMLFQQYIKQADIKKLKEIINKYQSLKAYKQYKRAFSYLLYFEKNYKQLIDYLELESEKSIELLNLLGKSYTKISEFEKATEVYQFIVKQEPNNYEYWYNLASSLSHLTSNTDLSLSIKAVSKCLELNPNFHKALYCKTLVFEKLNQYDKAIIEIKKAIEIEGLIEYKYKLAELLNYINQKTLSIKQLDEILELNPNHHLANRLIGIINLKQEKFNESETYLKKSLLSDDRDQRAIAYYAISKIAQNKINEVEEFLSLGHFVKEFNFNPKEFYTNINEFNKDLEYDIKNHSQLRLEPNGLAARNGYLTDDLFKDDTKSIRLFKKLLFEKIDLYINELPSDLNHHMLKHKTKDFELNSWATWVKGDGFIDKHIHEESWISGAYYCKVPKITESTDEKNGYFEYGCIPHDIKVKIPKKRGYIKPVEGKLIIFPSYLYHQTIPHETDEDRISIAFDLTPKSWK